MSSKHIPIKAAADLATYLCTDGVPNVPDNIVYIPKRIREPNVLSSANACFNAGVLPYLKGVNFLKIPSQGPERVPVDTRTAGSYLSPQAYTIIMNEVGFFKTYLEVVLIKHVIDYMQGETRTISGQFKDFSRGQLADDFFMAQVPKDLNRVEFTPRITQEFLTDSVFLSQYQVPKKEALYMEYPEVDAVYRHLPIISALNKVYYAILKDLDL